MAVYLSSTTRQFFEHGTAFGCMFNITRRTKRQAEALEAGCLWMLDNGAFSGKWTFWLWLREMWALRRWRRTCLGVVVPDGVAAWRATLIRFLLLFWLPKLLGYRVAFATQDGQPLALVPWPLFDCLFIGGSDEHKRGPEAERLGLAAREYDKHVHIGRCNSGAAMVVHWPWADSYDGTTFSHHPTQQVESILGGLTIVATQSYQRRKLL